MNGLIKKRLEETFRIRFEVKRNDSDFEEYIIKPSENLNDAFVIRVTIKEDIRITITCEPDTYGRVFLENINKSNYEQRKIFCEFWEKLDIKKIKLLINDIEFDCNRFMNDTSNWNTFLLKFTKNDFYDDEKDNKEEAILDYISLFMSMVLAITTYEINGNENENLQDFIKISEGTPKEIKSIRYERNPINRKICLVNKGYTCSICGFDFEKVYGKIGKNFIEVHHIMPVSKMDKDYKFDPIKDLFPVCSNCHSMIHRKDPPYSIEELKNIINDMRSKLDEII